MMKMKMSHFRGFGSTTGMYVPYWFGTLFPLIVFSENCFWSFSLCMHQQVRGDVVDDPTTYLVAFGESEAHYVV